MGRTSLGWGVLQMILSFRVDRYAQSESPFFFGAAPDASFVHLHISDPVPRSG